MTSTQAAEKSAEKAVYSRPYVDNEAIPRPARFAVEVFGSAAKKIQITDDLALLAEQGLQRPAPATDRSFAADGLLPPCREDRLFAVELFRV